MVCQRSKSHDVRAATWNVSSMVGRTGEVPTLYTEEIFTSVCSRHKVVVQICFVLLVEDTAYRLLWHGCNK